MPGSKQHPRRGLANNQVLRVLAAVTGLLLSLGGVCADEVAYSNLISNYLHSEDTDRRQAIVAELTQTLPIHGVSKTQFEFFESALLAYQPNALEREQHQGVFKPYPITVTLPQGKELSVLIQLPPGYATDRSWPLLFAMHGGPGRSPEDGKRGADNMRNAWQQAAGEAGWIVASPAMSHVFVHGRPSPERLAYEILTVDQMEAILASVVREFRIDTNRIVSTGVSLGANFSIGYAGARPDRFAAIAPVSGEGEFREWLLRNFMNCPVFAVSGGRDRNIRTIEGPRAMHRILTRFGYDSVYNEHTERGHEGFQALYPQILDWVDKHPRNPHPLAVLRAPHAGIMPLSRRVHWLAVDTRQGVASGEIKSANRIDLKVRWARSVTLYLHDRLVDLDQPVTVFINGELVFTGRLERSIEFALRQVRKLRDRSRAYPASVQLEVPISASARDVAKTWFESFSPVSAGGPLSYWEHFAVGTLEERFPSLGFDGKSEPMDDEYAAIVVTAVQASGAFHIAGIEVGDRLLEIDGEPFVSPRGVAFLKRWLERELTTTPTIYPLLVQRNGRPLTLNVVLNLEPF